MLTIILKNKNIIKIYKYLVITFKFLNKYLYLLSFLSLINTIYNKYRTNKFYKPIKLILKIILMLNLIVCTGIILYLTDFGTPINTTFSLYSDLLQPFSELLKPYIDFLKNLWNDLINFSVEDSIVSQIKDSNDIQNQIKVGIKEGVKEALNEILTEVNLQSEANVQPVQSETILESQPNYLLKDLALYSSLIFFGYFLFVLPGPSISPEVLTEYNFINQSLIELKITVKDLIINYFSNPGAPPAPTNPSVGDSPISPTSLNTYFPLIESNSVGSEGLSTVTPNTPIVRNIPISSAVSKGTQTTIDGILVSKNLETVDILSNVLDDSSSTMITDCVNKTIKNITD